MKSSYDKHGNLIPGTTILQDLLEDKRKVQMFLEVLEKLDMHIVSNAEIKDKNTLWIKKN